MIVINLIQHSLKQMKKEETAFIVLDSMGGHQDKAVEILKEYLETEWRAKTGEVADMSRLMVVVPKLPIQDNYFDCGVFLLQYIERIFEEVQHFLCPNTISSMTQEEWFSLSTIYTKRADIAALIRKLSEDQHKGETIYWPNITFTTDTEQKNVEMKVKLEIDSTEKKLCQKQNVSHVVNKPMFDNGIMDILSDLNDI